MFLILTRPEDGVDQGDVLFDGFEKEIVSVVSLVCDGCFYQMAGVVSLICVSNLHLLMYA